MSGPSRPWRPWSPPQDGPTHSRQDSRTTMSDLISLARSRVGMSRSSATFPHSSNESLQSVTSEQARATDSPCLYQFCTSGYESSSAISTSYRFGDERGTPSPTSSVQSFNPPSSTNNGNVVASSVQSIHHAQQELPSPWNAVAPLHIPSRVVTRIKCDSQSGYQVPIARFKSRPNIINLKTSEVERVCWAKDFEGVKYDIQYRRDAFRAGLLMRNGADRRLLTAGDHVVVDSVPSPFVYQLTRIRLSHHVDEFLVDVFAFDKEGNHIAEASFAMEPFVLNIPAVFIDPLTFYIAPEAPGCW